MKRIKAGRNALLVKSIEKLEEQGHPYQMAVSMAKGTWVEPEEEQPEEEEEKKGSPGKALFGFAAEKAKEEEERKKKEAEEERKREEEEKRAKEDFELWGRYWIWEEYIDPEHYPYWEDASNRLFGVNEHVQ
jgi:hypothetical protein